jgi:hypothetical protein
MSDAEKQSWKTKQRVAGVMRKIMTQPANKAEAVKCIETSWGMGCDLWPVREELVDNVLKPFRSKASGMAELRSVAERCKSDACHKFVNAVSYNSKRYQSMDAAVTACKPEMGKFVDSKIAVDDPTWAAVAATKTLQAGCFTAHPGFCRQKDSAIADKVRFLVGHFRKIGATSSLEPRGQKLFRVFHKSNPQQFLFFRQVCGTIKPWRSFFAPLKAEGKRSVASTPWGFTPGATKLPVSLSLCQATDLCQSGLWGDYELAVMLVRLDSESVWTFDELVYQQPSTCKFRATATVKQHGEASRCKEAVGGHVHVEPADKQHDIFDCDFLKPGNLLQFAAHKAHDDNGNESDEGEAPLPGDDVFDDLDRDLAAYIAHEPAEAEAGDDVGGGEHGATSRAVRSRATDMDVLKDVLGDRPNPGCQLICWFCLHFAASTKQATSSFL